MTHEDFKGIQKIYGTQYAAHLACLSCVPLLKCLGWLKNF